MIILAVLEVWLNVETGKGISIRTITGLTKWIDVTGVSVILHVLKPWGNINVVCNARVLDVGQ